MTSIAKENLDERIERIKKRNEEIEKKYREAEEDRLMALKKNAMVEIKPPKDDKDWPKAHKYDKIDFTYDVKPEKLEELEKQKKENKQQLRDYKKFADGEGPPPDPAYNFLADAERDGTTITSHKNENNRKDSRQYNSGGKNQIQQQQHHKRGAPNNNSFRGNGGGRGSNNKNYNQKNQNSKNSQPEYEQWRNEREKIDEARINRQKVGDGKWRREWDNDKINAENEALLRPEKITLGDAFNNVNINKKSPVHNGNNHHGGGGGCKLNRQNSGHSFVNPNDCIVEKRANVTVSVSKTGEVKSVKLTSAPAIGTGRVGPRQISKPQFSIQTVEREIAIQEKAPPISPNSQRRNQGKSVPTQIHVNSNGSNIYPPHLKIPNNKSTATNQVITSQNNVNSGKIKKDKKHSPSSGTIDQQTGNNTQILKSNNVAAVQIGLNKQQNIQKTTKLKNLEVGGIENQSTALLQPSPILTASNISPVLPAPLFSGDIAVTPPSSAIQPSPLSANEIPILPIVDLSHKPEFQKRSIQDRLLRVRQANSNQNNTAVTTTAVSNTVISDNNAINASNTNISTSNIASSTQTIHSNLTEAVSTTDSTATTNTISTAITTSTREVISAKQIVDNVNNNTETTKVVNNNDKPEEIPAKNNNTTVENCDKQTEDVETEIKNDIIPLSSSVEAVIACN